jgi:hypothetical protein
MENANPLVEVLVYFALGVVLAFAVIPLFIVATGRSRR